MKVFFIFFNFFIFFLLKSPKTRLNTTLGSGLQGRKHRHAENSVELEVGIDIPLKRWKIIVLLHRLKFWGI